MSEPTTAELVERARKGIWWVMEPNAADAALASLQSRCEELERLEREAWRQANRADAERADMSTKFTQACSERDRAEVEVQRLTKIEEAAQALIRTKKASEEYPQLEAALSEEPLPGTGQEGC